MKTQKQLFSYLILILLCIACSTQKTSEISYISEDAVHTNIIVKGRGYIGVIFPVDYNDMPFRYNWITDIKEQTTLTLSDINSAEKILKKGIKEISKNAYYPDHPIIHEKLSKYIRQYFGYINSDGDKIVFINCFWPNESRFARFINRTLYNEQEDESWKTEYYHVLDGGTYYWKVKVNLTKEILFDFGTNGTA